jgi:hypothetical protein
VRLIPAVRDLVRRIFAGSSLEVELKVIRFDRTFATLDEHGDIVAGMDGNRTHQGATQRPANRLGLPVCAELGAVLAVIE